VDELSFWCAVEFDLLVSIESFCLYIYKEHCSTGFFWLVDKLFWCGYECVCPCLVNRVILASRNEFETLPFLSTVE
jgi:hypothetical protein